jgi:hypothetical protein
MSFCAAYGYTKGQIGSLRSPGLVTGKQNPIFFIAQILLAGEKANAMLCEAVITTPRKCQRDSLAGFVVSNA